MPIIDKLWVLLVGLGEVQVGGRGGGYPYMPNILRGLYSWLLNYLTAILLTIFVFFAVLYRMIADIDLNLIISYPNGLVLLE